MSKFGDAMRGLTVFISDIRNCKGEGGRDCVVICLLFKR